MLELTTRAEESGSDLRVASILMNEVLSSAQASLRTIASHVDAIIAQRRVIRRSVKSAQSMDATSTKDSGQQSSRTATGKQSTPSPELAEKLAEIHTSVEQLSASSGSMLQVDHSLLTIHNKLFPLFDL